MNVYVADLSPWIPRGGNVYGVRENGNRLIRARYPNANPELGFGSTLQALSWVPSVLPKNPDIEVWCGVVWCGVVWCGVVWCGVVWCGVVWCGVVWGVVVCCGVVWCGVVGCGVVWCGVVWCGVVWCGVVWCGVAWCGVVWCGVVWCEEEGGRGVRCW